MCSRSAPLKDLIFKIQPGVCDKSFGIHVAELVNFPKDIIEDANRRLQR